MELYLQLFILQSAWILANFIHHGFGQMPLFSRFNGFDDKDNKWVWPTFQSDNRRMNSEVPTFPQANATTYSTFELSPPPIYPATTVGETSQLQYGATSTVEEKHGTSTEIATLAPVETGAANVATLMPNVLITPTYASATEGQNTTIAPAYILQEIVQTTNVPVQTTFAHDTQSAVITIKQSETSTANSAPTVAPNKENSKAPVALNYTEPKTFATTSEHSEKCIISTAATVPTTTAKIVQVQKDSLTGSSGPRDTRESINRLKQALLSPNMGSVFTHASTAGQQLEEKYGAPAARNPAQDSRPSNYGGENSNYAEADGNGYGIGTGNYQNGPANYARGPQAKGGGGIGSGIKSFFAKLFSFPPSAPQHQGYEKYHMTAQPDSSVLPINPPVVTLRINADFVELDCIAYGQIQYGLRWVKLVGLNPYGHELFATVADGERVLMDTYHYAVRTDGKHSRLIIRNPDPRLHYGIYECQATVAGSPNVVVKEDFVVGRVA